MIQPRPPRREEITELHTMAVELAHFEKIAHLVKSTPEDLERVIFDEKILEGLVVEKPEGAGLAGFAIFYRNFSSFTGKTGLWLEDLYVRPEFRSQGIGSRLLDQFLETARERDYGRAEWSVLEWNEGAIEFYRSRKADVMPDWRICRVTF